ncbi:outer membrane channel protein TolC [Vibrio methylphosphonaticus]|uniref:outer membrane channel protein TolC n=1 Tax=Vibrio methylphosphonaticus TaxID=2946866 RepID=UPI002029E28F|nr:outer membrane channel protein TolC [Vibrio methylphosphonaticus]MCL9775631.1 outer membrane channel protein TolC [Vibrio methylphosphonaticus]
MKHNHIFMSLLLFAICSPVNADSLSEVYSLAKTNDPLLIKAAAQRDSAFEAINSTRSSLLPQIDLTAGYAYQDSDLHATDGNSTELSLGLSQSIYDRSSWIALSISEKNARGSDARYASTQQIVMFNVAKAYFDVLKAEDDLSFVKAEQNAVAKQLKQTEQRFNVGVAPITDVQDAKAQYDSVVAQQIQATNTVENKYEDLRAITGKEASLLAVLDTDRFSPSLPNRTIEEMVEKATNENLRLLTSRINKDIAKEQIALAQSGHLPTVALLTDYSYSKHYNQPISPITSDDDVNQFNLRLSVDLPVYSGGRVTSEAKQAEFQYIAASQDLESTYRDVQKQVRAINNNIRSSIGSIKAYTQSVVSAKSALSATQEGFEVGTRTIVDVLESTQNLYQANKDLANARYQYILSQIELKLTVGTLSEQDIIDIDAGLKSVD